MKFFEVISYNAALDETKNLLKSSALGAYSADISECTGKISAGDIIAGENLPPFDKSTVDGYAVKARDTYGAAEAVPALLKVVGRVEMGGSFEGEIKSGQAVYIPTGGKLPTGADSAVMIENCEPFGSQIAVNKSVTPGGNILSAGADIKKGVAVLKRGEPVTPFNAGLLAGLGISSCRVYKPLRVGVISTGDELADISDSLSDGKVRDVNTYLLSALAAAEGHHTVFCARCKDDFEELYSAVKNAADVCDVVFVSGGSSVGTKDYTYAVMEKLCAGIAFKGIALKPGKPTIAGMVNQAAVFGLPGHPMAAAVVAETLVFEAVRRLRGETKSLIYASAATNFPSSPGRTTCQPVSLAERDGTLFAEPLFSKSGAISSLKAAYGYVLLDETAEGVNAGQKVTVRRFE